MHTAVHLLDEVVHIAPPPLVTLGLAAAHACGPVALEAVFIGEGQIATISTLDRIGIEVVVDVHTVQVIALHHVGDHLQAVLLHLGLAGVEPHHVAITVHPGRVAARHVLRMQRPTGRWMACPIGVEPGVQFQPLGVAGLHPQSQSIEVGTGLTLCMQVVAGRLQIGPVQGVSGGAYLHDQRVEPHGLRSLNDVQNLRAQGGGTQARLLGPVDVGHAGHPGGAPFAWGAWGLFGRAEAGLGQRACTRGYGLGRQPGGLGRSRRHVRCRAAAACCGQPGHTRSRGAQQRRRLFKPLAALGVHGALAWWRRPVSAVNRAAVSASGWPS